MKIEGRKRYVKRAVYAACLLNIYDFRLAIVEIENDNYSYVVQEGPKEFLMCIEKGVPKPLLMEWIAHEMIHVAQYLRGDLKDDEEGTLWKGELYNDPEHLSDEYFWSPWEMEARALESWIDHRWNTRSKNELH